MLQPLEGQEPLCRKKSTLVTGLGGLSLQNQIKFFVIAGQALIVIR